MKISKEKLENEYGLPHDCADNVLVIQDTMYQKRRWTIVHRMIVQIDQKYYEIYWSEAATENQEQDPWDWAEQVEFNEVIPVEKVVTVYEKIL